MPDAPQKLHKAHDLGGILPQKIKRLEGQQNPGS